MKNNIRYFVAGITAKGWTNLLMENIKQIKHMISLQHPSKAFKTAILQKLIEHFKEEQTDVEVILSASGDQFLEGVIVREHSLAIITDTITPEKFTGEEFSLISFTNIDENTTDIHPLMSEELKEAYHYYSKALAIHEQLEAIYIGEMDFSKADDVAETFKNNVLKEINKQSTPSIIKRRFFGANTPQGPVNIVPELLERVGKRYHLKGRAGTGKSTFMRNVAEACESLHLDMEIYHCSFDPESIDMVLVPDANFCVFDSTGPHTFQANHENDYIIDLYDLTVTPGTDAKFAIEIDQLEEAYKNEIKQAAKYVKQYHEKEMEVEGAISFTDTQVVSAYHKLMKAITK